MSLLHVTSKMNTCNTRSLMHDVISHYDLGVPDYMLRAKLDKT